MQHKFHLFTLVELLIVIAIIGFLAALMIPRFSNLTDSARDTSDAANLATLQRQLENFNAANGHYPSPLHTGLNTDGDGVVSKIDSTYAETGESFFTATMTENINNRTAAIPATDLPGVKKALNEGGVRSLLYGFNDYYGTPINTVAKPIRHISEAWTDPKGNEFLNEGYKASADFWGENFYFIPLFVSNRTNWNVIWDFAGTKVGTSKILIDEPPQAPLPGTELNVANYYVLLFRVDRTARGASTFHPARLVSVFSPNDATLGSNKKSANDGKSF